MDLGLGCPLLCPLGQEPLRVAALQFPLAHPAVTTVVVERGPRLRRRTPFPYSLCPCRLTSGKLLSTAACSGKTLLCPLRSSDPWSLSPPLPISERFGTTVHRRCPLAGLREALAILGTAGCRAVYIDGSMDAYGTARLDAKDAESAHRLEN